MNDQGLSRLIMLGMGAGVLPVHVIKHLEKTGSEIYQFPGTTEPLKNTISIAYIENHSLNPAINLVREYIVTELKSQNS